MYLCLYCTFVLEIIAQSITFFTLKAVKWKLPPRNLDLLKMPVSFLLLLRYYWNQMLKTNMKIFCIIVWYYVWVLFIIFDTEFTWVMEYVRFNPLQLCIRKMRRLKSGRNSYKTRNQFSQTKITLKLEFLLLVQTKTCSSFYYHIEVSAWIILVAIKWIG